MFPHEIAVEQCHRPAAHFEELNQKHVGDRRFTCTGKTGKKHSQSLFVPRREGTPQFLAISGKVNQAGISRPSLKRRRNCVPERLSTREPGGTSFSGKYLSRSST